MGDFGTTGKYFVAVLLLVVAWYLRHFQLVNRHANLPESCNQICKMENKKGNRHVTA